MHFAAQRGGISSPAFLLLLLLRPYTQMDEPKKNPVVIITIGMAGAGKSTFVQRINSYLHAKETPPYILNLDPAVTHIPFEPNIDIRDTINYHEVMKECVDR